VRRATVAIVVAIPAALLTFAAADAGAGRAASPPSPGAFIPVSTQAADVTRKARPASLPTTSHRSKRLRADDAATPQLPGAAPAVAASSPLTAAQDAVRHAECAQRGARAPPEAA
jgi:hypothetical protein